MDVTGRLSLGHAQSLGRSLPGSSCSAQWLKFSKTLRVANRQADGFVHLSSHLLLRNNTVLFFWALNPLVESSFSEANVFLSPELFALLHRGLSQSKRLFY